MKRNLLLIVLTAAVVLMSFKYFEAKQDYKASVNRAEVANDSISHFKNRLGLVVAERQALQGNAKELNAYIDKQGKQLREALRKNKPTTATKIVTKTVIDSVEIEYEDPISDFFEYQFEKTTDHYIIKGISKNTGLLLSSIVIPNEQSVVVGSKKISLFKREYRAEVTNSNPLIQVTELTSFRFDDKKQRFGAGPYIGIDLTGKLNFGVSVQYSLLRF